MVWLVALVYCIIIVVSLCKANNKPMIFNSDKKRSKYFKNDDLNGMRKRSQESKKKLIASNPFFIFAGCKVAAIVALKQHAVQ